MRVRNPHQGSAALPSASPEPGRQILQTLATNKVVRRIVEVAAVFSAPVQTLGPVIVEAHAQAPRQLPPDPKTTVNFITARLESNIRSELLSGVGKVALDEASKLVSAMKQGLPELRVAMVAHEVAAKRGLTGEAMALLTTALSPRDATMATPLVEHQGTSAIPTRSPMMRADGARYQDVRQGAVGNCYFAASAAAIVARDPSFPRRIIEERRSLDGNLSYAVRLSPVLLHLPQGSMSIEVNDAVWGNRGAALYAHDNGASWFQMLEMASAKIDGGFGPTESGFGFEGLARLTGMTASYTLITPAHDREATFSSLKSHNDAGHAMTTGAHIWSDTSFAATWTGRFSEQHEYAVIDVRGSNADDAVLVLYNPSGSELTISIDEFQRNFLGFSWLDLQQPSLALPTVQSADRANHVVTTPVAVAPVLDD